MADVISARYLRPGQGRAIWWLGGRGVFLAAGADTGGAFGLWEDSPPPGGGPVPHVHSREEEFFYVLDGELVYEAGGQSFTATPGALVCLPRGVPHRFRNGPTWARLLVFVAPGGNEQMFLDLAAPDTSADDPTAHPDPARFAAAAEKYGVTLIPPDAADWAKRTLPVGEGRVPTTRRPGEGERLTLGAAACVLKATAAETGGAYTLAEVELPPAASLGERSHAGHAVGVYVLEGTPSLRLDGRDVRASAGGFAFVPPGRPYALENRGDYPARALWVAAPGGLEDGWRGEAGR